MRRRIVIKICKLKPSSPNDNTKLIVVGYNRRPNGIYIEKIGVFYKEANKVVMFMNIKRLSFWLRKDVVIKSKVSWIIGMLAQAEFYGY